MTIPPSGPDLPPADPSPTGAARSTDPSPGVHPTPPADPTLETLTETLNTELEDAAIEPTQNAFNLGCLLGLLPAALFAAITFIAIDFGLIGVAMAIVLGITGAVAFANLAAMITRRNTLRRTYRELTAPQIDRHLAAAGRSRREFDLAAHRTLPPTAALIGFLETPAPAPEDPSL